MTNRNLEVKQQAVNQALHDFAVAYQALCAHGPVLSGDRRLMSQVILACVAGEDLLDSTLQTYLESRAPVDGNFRKVLIYAKLWKHHVTAVQSMFLRG